ncbi:hypothetical protein LTR86_004393 [Recurvomyces mirabilis]|nr:hypothetical protein LTR86_004393 [Recurvomyces mirabilis]
MAGDDDQNPCHLLRLTPELHLRILDCVLPGGYTVSVSFLKDGGLYRVSQIISSPSTRHDNARALAATCRELSSRLHPEIYRRTTLTIRVFPRDVLSNFYRRREVQFHILSLPFGHLRLEIAGRATDPEDDLLDLLYDLAGRLREYDGFPAVERISFESPRYVEADDHPLVLALGECIIMEDAVMDGLKIGSDKSEELLWRGVMGSESWVGLEEAV